ncbi:MAG: lipopolysaccharide biosynthesis protein RfbH [Candidatus Altiarchaeota archaeon]|nr:lipopolysaccharide biosynthesis protein RfbH [Candidatus Altiarchaeota archaeon]
MKEQDKDELRKQVLEKVREYHKATAGHLPRERVPVSGKVFDEEELVNLLDASLAGWWTDGEYVDSFEEKLSGFLGVKHAVSCNSGSSANLLAFASLSSHLLDAERRINPGDEVLTIAAGFPTTVNPTILYGCVPVFLDIEPGTYNVDVSRLAEAVTKKTKAVFMAHTLGNPFNLKEVLKVAEENDLWLIEDNCDSLGAKYDNRYTGSFGHLSTLSFYPAHHITTAEGGAILTNDPLLDRILRSLRDWGRDCWCKPGQDNTCGRRFSLKFGELPEGYDHKYVYSHVGFNLKMTDLQAAIGVAQTGKLEGFIEKRKENFTYLYERLRKHEKHLLLPKATENSEPSWFGFPLTVKDPAIKREELTQYLERNGVSTRLLFAGNVTKQPYFIDYNVKYRAVGDLACTDCVMKDTFWVGVYPALGKEQLDHMISVFDAFFRERTCQ